MKNLFFVSIRFFFLVFIGQAGNLFAQGIGVNPSGTNPDPSALLDLNASPGNNKGLLIPRLTTSQRNAIGSPARGLIIYNTDCDELQYYNGGTWISLINSLSIAAPAANAASTVTQTSFSANWSSATGATIYYLDVSSNSSFSSFVTGFNNLNVGNVTTYSVTGVSCGSTYYYRLRAGNSCSTSMNSNSVTVTVGVCCTSNTWTQKANFTGQGRRIPVCFSIGTKGYIGTGYNVSGTILQDFWEYDQTANTWAQKANFPGPARWQSTGFSIGTKGYIGTGWNAASTVMYQDFYEWDQGTNTWTQKANFGGTARGDAVGFSIGTKGYIGTGYDGARKNDFYEYNQSTDTWTAIASFSGVAREGATAFSIGSKGYVASGNIVGGYTQELWEYDQTSGTWSAKATFSGAGRGWLRSFSIGTKGYIGLGFNGAFLRDFWEWDQTSNTWTQKAQFAPSVRTDASGFSIGSKGYLGLGWDGGSAYSTDLWEYCQ